MGLASLSIKAWKGFVIGAAAAFEIVSIYREQVVITTVRSGDEVFQDMSDVDVSGFSFSDLGPIEGVSMITKEQALAMIRDLRDCGVGPGRPSDS